jgi:hypothetical protein
LAGGVDGENALGEIWLFEASAGFGFGGGGTRFRQEVTFITQNPIDTDKIHPIM